MSRYAAAKDILRVSEVLDDSDASSDEYDSDEALLATRGAIQEFTDSEGDDDESDGESVAAGVEEEEAANLAKLEGKDVIAGQVFCSVCPRKFFVKVEDYKLHVVSKKHLKAKQQALSGSVVVKTSAPANKSAAEADGETKLTRKQRKAAKRKQLLKMKKSSRKRAVEGEQPVSGAVSKPNTPSKAPSDTSKTDTGSKKVDVTKTPKSAAKRPLAEQVPPPTAKPAVVSAKKRKTAATE